MSNRFMERRRVHLQPVERDPERYQAASREAIIALTRRMERAWSSGDGAAYAAVFSADCDYVAVDGTHLHGRDSNARHHQKLFDSLLRNTRLVFDGLPAVRFLAEDVALVHAMGAVLFAWQTRVTPPRRSKQTLVAVRGPEGWRFVAFHGVRYRPAAVPSGFALKLALAWRRARAWISHKLPR